MSRPLTRSFAVALLVAASGAGVAPASAVKPCERVVDPYPGTRYEGSDLRGIRATKVSCARARRVARRAHRKALGITPPPNGVRRFSWNGWQVTGDLRGDSDRYKAVRGAKRVNWRF